MSTFAHDLRLAARALWLAGAGLALRLAAAWGVTRLLDGLLFGVAAHDPASTLRTT